MDSDMPAPDRPDRQAEDHLYFVDELIRDRPAILGVVELNGGTWGVLGELPFEGEVILAEFGSYDEARSVLGQRLEGSLDEAPPRAPTLE